MERYFIFKYSRERVIEIENNKLKQSLVEKFGNQEKAAKALKISRSSLNQKLNGKREWTAKQIQLLVCMFDISSSDIKTLFFDQKC
ncbi:hypothetical protein ATX59_00545 [Oenococcus oeni]|uniref:Uncharacterized protein n=1 Tax=Oenococcus oeni TaxID=1247 RepID=A0A6N4A9B6_OENOE|nr:DUF739 family protein [Oenococcus oeni]OIM22151.1 hypothetical protein ATX59_00545 [Oenococcus oeni]